MIPLELLVESLDWYDDAACRGRPTDWWFPERGDDNANAVAICNSCPVQVECLTYALEERMTEGVWGGTSAKERRKLRRAAGLVARPRPVPDHGTRARYGRGCKCDRCRAANAVYTARMRQ